MFIALSWDPPLSVDSISIGAPYGERALIVERSGHAILSESGKGDLTVRRGLFDVDDLFQQSIGAVVHAWDEDKRIDQRLGAVRIFFSNDTSGTYLIYDQEYVDELLNYAKSNVIGSPWPYRPDLLHLHSTAPYQSNLCIKQNWSALTRMLVEARICGQHLLQLDRDRSKRFVRRARIVFSNLPQFALKHPVRALDTWRYCSKRH